MLRYTVWLKNGSWGGAEFFFILHEQYRYWDEGYVFIERKPNDTLMRECINSSSMASIFPHLATLFNFLPNLTKPSEYSSVTAFLFGKVGSKYQQQSFWGTPTATVDWCEENYALTRYVAEFFNSFSSLSLILCGVLGVLFHMNHVEMRYLCAFGGVILVGIGSTAFHGTLLFEFQVCTDFTSLLMSTRYRRNSRDIN